MRKLFLVFTFASAAFTGAYSQVIVTKTITVSGNVKIHGLTDYSGATVIFSSLICDKQSSSSVPCVNDTTLTTADGTYTRELSFTYDSLATNAFLPLQVIISKDTLADTIAENISIAKTGTTYKISQDVILGTYTPQICIVTVDTALNQNTIAWDRYSAQLVKEYKILRSKTINGSYTQIGSVLHSSTYSVFKDPDTRPGIDTAFYKIKAVFTDNSESAMSTPKTNLSLKVTFIDTIPYLNLLNLEDMATFNPTGFSSIQIKKSKINSGFYTYMSYRFNKYDLSELLSSIKDSTFTGTTYYVASATLKETCYTNSLKSDSGPYSQSLSNIAEATLIETNAKAQESMKLEIYPVPSSNKVQIKLPESGGLQVLDLEGRVIVSQNAQEGVYEFNGYTKGVYVIVLKASKTYTGKIVIK